jgi:hypothetical protein
MGSVRVSELGIALWKGLSLCLLMSGDE